jgi:NitT/TauT family transport system permease protein
MVALTRSGVLPTELGITLSRLLAGYAIGVAAGIAVGFAMALSPYAKAALYPLLAGSYPVPKLALLPLVMMVFGLGESSKIAMVAISAFFLLPFNILTAVEHVDRIYVDVARNLGVSRWLFWRTVALPYALPMIFAGLRLAWAISLIVIVATEMLAAKSGLGFMIWKASQVFDTKAMFSAFVTIGLLGYTSHVILELATRLAVPWQKVR